MNWQGLFSKIFLVQCSLIIAFFCSEVLYRFISDKSIQDNIFNQLGLELVPRPYVMSVTNPKLSNINQLGYPGVLPHKVKAADELRVFILGGSTVFGDSPNYTNKEILPLFIENKLQKKYGNRIKVFNFGVAGSVTNQDLMRLVNDVVSFSPDLIISYGGGNDIISSDRRAGYPHFFALYESNPLFAAKAEDYEVLPLMALESEILRKVFRQDFKWYFQSRGEERFENFEDFPLYKDYANNYIESIKRMKVISNAFNSKFMAVFQPMKAYYFDDVFIGKKTRLFRKKVLSQSSSVELHDLSLLLKGRPESWWRDMIHVYPIADQVIAEYLVGEIEKKLEKSLN